MTEPETATEQAKAPKSAARQTLSRRLMYLALVLAAADAAMFARGPEIVDFVTGVLP